MPLSDRNPYLIALGSNLAPVMQDNLLVITRALEIVASRTAPPRRVSRFWRTPAWPPGSGPDFVNACAVLDSDLPPAQLLAILHGIEADLGRQRQARWGPRVIDLDLLAQGDAILPDRAALVHWMTLAPSAQQVHAPDQLILPHPRLQDRAFVLVPLAEIAPDWCHPVTGQTVIQMRDALDPRDLAGVVPL